MVRVNGGLADGAALEPSRALLHSQQPFGTESIFPRHDGAMTQPIRIGTAGWTVPSKYLERVPAGGSHLERYARHFNVVEINSSFHRPHRRATYERWAESVPQNFRFSV